MTTLITSLNEKLLDLYGRRMLQEFQKSSRDVKLIVVFEGNKPADLSWQQGLVRLVELRSEKFDRFQKFFGRLYEAHGLKIVQKRQEGGGVHLQPVWDYRFNLVRFAFKIFSIDLARKSLSEGEYFAWLDADVRCLKGFDSADLQRFFPDGNQIMSYLGRTHFPPGRPYSECGFLGFNPLHPELDSFLNRMLEVYTTGEAFRFEEWHDSWLWDEIRREFEARGHCFKNISGSAVNLEHPFVNCGLGDYFDHLKGPGRKNAGASFQSDYSKPD